MKIKKLTERDLRRMEKKLEACEWIHEQCGNWEDPFTGAHEPTTKAYEIAMERLKRRSRAKYFKIRSIDLCHLTCILKSRIGYPMADYDQEMTLREAINLANRLDRHQFLDRKRGILWLWRWSTHRTCAITGEQID